ncbi:SUF system NifU family Fe-S cluster assembly protein [Patescibacteria group bacterium]|nr:SUF system NifU family Fe-S cluster assembly protein [Patescibacteria group bacterium]
MSFDMYREIIMDHYKNPRNFGAIKNADGQATKDNPLCGDSIQITYSVGKEKLSDIKFNGTGCSISLAGASVLTENIKGKKFDEVKNYTDEDFMKDLTVPISPARRKCALLGLRALRQAMDIEQHEN